jgi:hypothetical protein
MKGKRIDKGERLNYNDLSQNPSRVISLMTHLSIGQSSLYCINSYVTVLVLSIDVSDSLLDRCNFFVGVIDDCCSSSFFLDEKNVATVFAKPLFFLMIFSSLIF